MPETQRTAFISYSREDSEFALRLARELKAAGASVWIDQLDITPGTHWDNAIENALLDAPQMLVVLTPASSHSSNVRNEISFALDQGKIVVPVIYKDCIVPLQLQRQNRIDFRADYARGLAALLDHLRVAHPDQSVLDKATEEESSRKAAWQAREVETRRLEEFAERERQEHALRQKEAAARLAVQEAEQKSREQSERKSPQDHLWKKLASGRGPLTITWLHAIAVFAVISALALLAVRLRSAHAGAKWTALNTETTIDLEAITGSGDGRILYACGDQRLFLRSIDSGRTWARQTPGPFPNCLAMFSSSDGTRIWVAGAENTTHMSADGGATWKDLRLDPRPGSFIDMRSIFGTPDGTHLWEAGQFGPPEGGLYGRIYESDDSGATWAVRMSTADSYYSEISGISDGHFLAAVTYGGKIVESSDGGTDWQVHNSGSESVSNSIFVAAAAKIICAVGANGAISVSTDQGATWTTRPSGTTQILRRVFGSSDGRHLWIVGDGGIILESDDSGTTWSPRTSATKAYFRSIFGTSDGKHLWAVGSDGTILESKSRIW
jgi:photosystem II stability/assembly factor-like uncharacterized protein